MLGRVIWLASFMLLAQIPGLAAAETPTPLADQVRDILKTHCYRCHGADGSVEGSLNYVTDLGKLVERKKVVPGKASSSRLFRRVEDGSMPPPGEGRSLTAEEVDTLRRWIDSGALGVQTSAPVKRISQGEVQAAILADLEQFDRRARRFQRYLTLTHLHNAGLNGDELQTYRNALAKLANSLSWYPTIRNPEPIDGSGTILRIDLRWYQWDAAIWNRIVTEYPYGVLDDSIASRAIMVGTAAKMPVIRADWFIATASRAPLYYDILQLPQNLNELERQLRADATTNIQQERVMRVGFNGSGVSRFNRILERHDSIHGMYWRTYDFNEPPANLVDRANGLLLPDRRNIFAYPLGPAPLAEQPFLHIGGEVIFALPNGLHGYYLAKDDNTRLDKGPIAIVSDPRRPDRAVEAAVSCMSCHFSGILPKADQIRDHLEKNPRAFSRTDADLIRALYPPKELSLARMADDAKRYAEAVAKTGAKVSRSEAVSTITLKYEADVDLPMAAAELGLTADAFRQAIDASPTLTAHVGGLRTDGGTVTRAIWVQAFGDCVRELRLGSLFQANLNGPSLPDNTGELDPLESLEGTANSMLFSADGRRAFIASADRTVRLYDVEGQRDLKRYIGHSGSVWAVALSPDGKLLLSGSMDGTARLWDVESAQERLRVNEHTSLVSAVAFLPQTRWALSGGFDGRVICWKLADGQELWRQESMGFVTAFVTDPQGRFVLVASDRGITQLDAQSGQVIRQYAKPSSAVTSLALSPKADRFVSGLDDGRVILWTLAEEKPTLELIGHGGSVRGVAWAPEERWLLSTGADRTLRLWDTAQRKEIAVFRKHEAPVIAGAFLANGTQTISGDRDVKLLPWRIDRILAEAAASSAIPVPDHIPLAEP